MFYIAGVQAFKAPEDFQGWSMEAKKSVEPEQSRDGGNRSGPVRSSKSSAGGQVEKAAEDQVEEPGVAEMGVV